MAWLFNEMECTPELVRRIRQTSQEERAELIDRLDQLCKHRFPEKVGGRKCCEICGLDAVFLRGKNGWFTHFVPKV